MAKEIDSDSATSLTHSETDMRAFPCALHLVRENRPIELGVPSGFSLKQRTAFPAFYSRTHRL